MDLSGQGRVLDRSGPFHGGDGRQAVKGCNSSVSRGEDITILLAPIAHRNLSARKSVHVDTFRTVSRYASHQETFRAIRCMEDDRADVHLGGALIFDLFFFSFFVFARGGGPSQYRNHIWRVPAV